jgi:MoaE-MoaD fusion protein
MNIAIRYFASARELMGSGKAVLDIEDGSTVEMALEHLAAGDARRGALFAACLPMVNQEYVERSHVLEDGDELALIPPVSGGEHDHVEVTDRRLEAAEAESLVATPGSGAIALFAGTVRDHARGRRVLRLDYEAYAPAAEKMLMRICDEIHEFWTVDRVAILHRTGTLEVGETSVIIGVSSPHRAEAFEACRHAIERIKQIVPIWKKEYYDGGSTWIGSEAEYQQVVAAES